jgi:hypothetical protein
MSAVGVLVGPGSALSGTANRFRAFSSSGALVGQGSLIVGTAARSGAPIVHDTSGSLVGISSIISGEARIDSVSADTPDGYWYKQWEKLHKKKPKLEDVIELVQERPATALAEVKDAVNREYPKIDYRQIAQNVELQTFIAKQILIALELRRIADDEEDDIEALLLL